MEYYDVVLGGQSFHGRSALTYSFDQPLQIGQLVTVPLKNSQAIGFVESKVKQPEYKTKSITRSWPLVLPDTSRQLLAWLRSYYPGTYGVLTSLFLPSALPQKLEFKEEATDSEVDLKTLPPLTQGQLSAIELIKKSSKYSFMLHGDTGTGKTRLYIELAAKAVISGKSVLIMTPEIGLTQQLIDDFSKVFGDRLVLTHSDLSPQKRRQAWLRVLSAKQPLVVIGPRSALFLPFNKLGLVVMDEAHDYAYKQEQTPFYQASRIAAELARLHSASFIMGSATPLIADYFAFENKKLPIIRLTQQAMPTTQKVDYKIVDLKDKSQFTRTPWLSNELLKAMENALKNQEQSLLFLNRRGTARLVLCSNCGWQSMCPRCDVPLTYHGDHHQMLCHTCGYKADVPSFCPVCSSPDLLFKAIGTKSLEEIVKKLLPQAKVSRFDSDTKEADKLRHQLEMLKTGQVDIIIGTQTIAKGFDLPKLAVVGVIQADSGLQIPDFSANERSYQLITQVAGRVGRGHRAGQLILQTYNPASPQFKMALNKDYGSFYEAELSERRRFGFPPYSFLLKLSCARASSNSAAGACQKLADQIIKSKLRVEVLGPSPSFIAKTAGKYRWQIVIKSKNRSALVNIISNLPAGVNYDIDPIDLL